MTGAYINQYVERLVVEFLQNQYFDWIRNEQIHKGFEKPVEGDLEGGVSIAQQKTPMIQAICAQAEPIVPNFKGNWNVQLAVTIVNSTRDTTDLVHEQRSDQVLSLFYDDGLPFNLIKIQPNFWCARIIPGATLSRIEGISFSSTGQFVLLSACASSMVDPNLFP